MQKYDEYMNLQSIFMKINIFKIIGTSTHRILNLSNHYTPQISTSIPSLYFISPY